MSTFVYNINREQKKGSHTGRGRNVKMKNFYIVVAVEQDRNESVIKSRRSQEYNAGYYAYIIKADESKNIKNSLDCIGGLLHANICQTKKRATQIAGQWNAVYKANGTYLFD